MDAITQLPRTNRGLQKLETRNVLLRTARTLFCQEGYECATMRDIADASGKSTGAIFGIFKDKADLLDAILTLEHAAYEDRLCDVLKRNRTIRRRLVELLSIDYEEPDRLALLRVEAALSWGMDPRAKSMLEERFQLLQKLVAERIIPRQYAGYARDLFGPAWSMHLENCRSSTKEEGAVLGRPNPSGLKRLLDKQVRLIQAGLGRDENACS